MANATNQFGSPIAVGDHVAIVEDEREFFDIDTANSIHEVVDCRRSMLVLAPVLARADGTPMRGRRFEAFASDLRKIG
jgi:hypothetical protein